MPKPNPTWLAFGAKGIKGGFLGKRTGATYRFNPRIRGRLQLEYNLIFLMTIETPQNDQYELKALIALSILSDQALNCTSLSMT